MSARFMRAAGQCVPEGLGAGVGLGGLGRRLDPTLADADTDEDRSEDEAFPGHRFVGGAWHDSTAQTNGRVRAADLFLTASESSGEVVPRARKKKFIAARKPSAAAVEGRSGRLSLRARRRRLSGMKLESWRQGEGRCS